MTGLTSGPGARLTCGNAAGTWGHSGYGLRGLLARQRHQLVPRAGGGRRSSDADRLGDEEELAVARVPKTAWVLAYFDANGNFVGNYPAITMRTEQNTPLEGSCLASVNRMRRVASPTAAERRCSRPRRWGPWPGSNATARPSTGGFFLDPLRWDTHLLSAGAVIVLREAALAIEAGCFEAFPRRGRRERRLAGGTGTPGGRADRARRARCGHGDRGLKAGVMQRSIDLGAASVVVRSPLREFNAQLDLLYRDHSQAGDSGFADVRVALLPGRLGACGARRYACGRRPPAPSTPTRSAAPCPIRMGHQLAAGAAPQRACAAACRRGRARGPCPDPSRRTGLGQEHADLRPSPRRLALPLGRVRVLDTESGLLHPLLKPAALKNRSIDIIGGQPGAVLGPVFAGTRKGDVAHFAPDRASVAARRRPVTPRSWCSRDIAKAQPCAAEPVRRAEAAMRLGLNSSLPQTRPGRLRRHPPPHAHGPAWEIEYGALADALPASSSYSGKAA